MQVTELEKTLMPHVGKISKMMAIYMADKFKQHKIDLTREQFILLVKLHKQDGLPQNDLAMITERNKASLTRLIHTMEKKNLVARVPSQEDKRVNRIYLTKKGRKIFKATEPIIKEMVKETQRGIKAQEIKSTISILQRMLNNINNA